MRVIVVLLSAAADRSSCERQLLLLHLSLLSRHPRVPLFAPPRAVLLFSGVRATQRQAVP